MHSDPLLLFVLVLHVSSNPSATTTTTLFLYLPSLYFYTYHHFISIILFCGVHISPQFAGGPIPVHIPPGAPQGLPAPIHMNINAFVHEPGAPQEPPAHGPGLVQGQAQVQANGEIHMNGVNIHPGVNLNGVGAGLAQPFVPSVVRSLLGLKVTPPHPPTHPPGTAKSHLNIKK